MRLVSTLIVAGIMAATGAAPAMAADGDFADVVGNARITSSGTAEVRARYSCSPDDPAVALWVAVKQGPALVETADGSGTSSRNAKAYAQSHAEVGLLQCDGKTHVGTFTVNQSEPTFPGAPPEASGFGTLQKGARTYVQVCITPASAMGEADVYSGMEFVRAV